METEQNKVYSIDKLKIMVVSTPKTGNTWIKNLLANIYELPIMDIGTIFSTTEANLLGTRWITHQHFTPLNSDLLDWAERNDAVFVTTIRHPCDVLLSEFHFVQNLGSRLQFADIDRTPIMMQDDDTMGEHTISYIRQGFSTLLEISLMWMQSGKSLIVSYEDLWRDPVTTLVRLTDEIHPAPHDRIESAIDLCDIHMLRKLYDDPQGKFFRKGQPGGWREELPQHILDILRDEEPYPYLFDALGYTLDPHDPLIDAPAKPRVSTNPFLENGRFDNEVKVPAIAIKLYLLADVTLKAQWHGAATATNPSSFFAWLNAPVETDTAAERRLPVITNLAYYAHSTRRDLQDQFPDPLNTDRIAYAIWFARNASKAFDLDTRFITPVRKSLLIWGNAPTQEDPYQPDALPVITNRALYIYRSRSDLQTAFADLFGADRSGFAEWFVKYAQKERALDQAFVEPVRSSLEGA